MEVYGLLKENNHQAALNRWQRLQKIIPLLFEESNPAPIKYVLKMLGLTSSAETRLPLTGISDDLKTRLQGICEQIKALL